MTSTVDKIRKMQAHAESAHKIGSEAEAQAFAAKIAELLETHKLQMSDIEFAAQDEEEPVGRNKIDYDAAGIPLTGKRTLWTEQLAGIIARAHFCRILIYRNSSRVTIIGRRSDSEVVTYMITLMYRTAVRLEAEAHKAFRRELRADGRLRAEATGFRRAFLLGFVQRLRERYEEARLARKVTQSSTALVRVDSSVKAVREWMNQNTRGFSAPLNSQARNETGFSAGRKGADGVSLNAAAVNDGGRGSARRALR